jgi:hypothetical protein
MLRLAADVGLKVVSVEHISNHPQYLMFSKPLYRMGVTIERSMLSRKSLAFLRQMILCELEKP